MKKSFTISLLFVTLLASGFRLLDPQKPSEKSNGWVKAGTAPDSYNMGVTTEEHHNGKACAFIKSKDSVIRGFGTIVQTCRPWIYLNKSVRMTAYIKTRDVKDWAGMWLRVDGAEQKVLGLDDMSKRPIRGTTDWQKYEIVLDVPQGAQDIAFGIQLTGTGLVLFDDVEFDVLGPTKASQIPDKPMDLDFEQ